LGVQKPAVSVLPIKKDLNYFLYPFSAQRSAFFQNKKIFTSLCICFRSKKLRSL